MILLLCGLSAYFVVQFTKVVFTPRLNRKTVVGGLIKMSLAALVALGTAWLLDPHQPRWWAPYALAGAALAMGVHKLVRVLSLYGDWIVTQVMRGRR